MLLLTLRGTPTMYQGDEIGMENVAIPPKRVQDPYERNVPGLGLGRDGERTPMQWDASRNAGFTGGEPWLPLAEDWSIRNVAAQRADPTSILSVYRSLLALRRGEEALSTGGYRPLDSPARDVLAFRRGDRGGFLVALNLGHRRRPLPLGELRGSVALSTHLDRAGEPVAGRSELRPDEGLIVRLK